MKPVLDASALLALVLQEPGAQKVLAALETGAVMSVVNLAEFIGAAERKMIPAEETLAAVAGLRLEFVDLNLETAVEMGRLEKICKPLGLSLGDRACLATGKLLNAKILTADRVWLKLNPEFKVEAIR